MVAVANSPGFRESMAVAATSVCGFINLHTGDPGTTGATEAASARGAITWVAGAQDGTVQGNELTLPNVPAGVYPYASLFSGASGANYQTSYLLPSSVVLASAGPVKLTPQFVYPG